MDIRYIAGFFDGDGSIGLYARGNRRTYVVRVQLTQNKTKESLLIFKFLRDTFGGNISEQITLSGNVKLNWQLGADGLIPFLRAITSHLIIKREQAEIAYEWLIKRPARKRDSHGRMTGVSNRFILYSEKCSKKLKMLKSKNYIPWV